MSNATTFSLTPVGFIQSSLKRPQDAPKQGHEGAPHAWLEVLPAVAKGALECVDGHGREM
jgi:hypothetical protein